MSYILVYSALKSGTQDFDDMSEWYAHECPWLLYVLTMCFRYARLPALIESGKLGNAIPLKRLEGGLEGIDAGLEYVRTGKASAEKLVFKL